MAVTLTHLKPGGAYQGAEALVTMRECRTLRLDSIWARGGAQGGGEVLRRGLRETGGKGRGLGQGAGGWGSGTGLRQSRAQAAQDAYVPLRGNAVSDKIIAETLDDVLQASAQLGRQPSQQLERDLGSEERRRIQRLCRIMLAIDITE